MTYCQFSADLSCVSHMVALALTEARVFLELGRAVKQLGTLRNELAKIAFIAVAGATVGHGLLALRLFDEA